MEKYHETVVPYLNTNPELDDAVFSLWNRWDNNESEINVEAARRDFLKATAISPNIGRTDYYVPHCLQVSRRCEETGRKVAKNYGFLEDELNPNKLAFMGLIEDSMYLIGGNGKNNPNGEDSNPYHEILTYAQMIHMGFNELAKGMAMHGVAHEILKIEQKKERLHGISPPKRNIALDILTGLDFLCTRDYLPDTLGSYEECLEWRIEDLRKRRNDPNHPLIVGLDNGGQEKLSSVLRWINRLEKGEVSDEEVRETY